MIRSLLVFFVLVITSSASLAANIKGYINNHEGDACWYTQETVSSTLFHDIEGAEVTTLTFKDPLCMKSGDLGDFGRNANIMMINNIITRPYSHSDANFQTNAQNLRPGSLMQKTGRCIQSKKYPMVGVMVDYELKNDSISRVFHSRSLNGCE